MYKTSDHTFSLECLDEQIIEYLTCIKHKINRSKLTYKCLQKYIVYFKPKYLYMTFVLTASM